ncbi:MAG: MFS transporter [Gammaproteobacteria bacterium]|jgi:GPH family glycoside/pentoside/hexuronide:cation symporter|nr:MFS transporter [Gammaproteobacteria bacterium]
MRLKLSWATGAFGVSILMNGVSAFTLFYFTTVIGIAPAVAGFLIFVSRVFDAVTDPLSGWISDRTQSRWGRRRPYLFAGSFVSAIAFVMVFTVPFQGPFENYTSGTGLLAAGYVLLALLIYTSGYSLFNVPYMAMPAEMTDGYHERSEIHGYRVMATAAGSFILQIIAGTVLEYGGKDWDAHAALGWGGAGLILAAMLTTTLGTRTAPEAAQVASTLSFAEQARSFFANRAFQQILAVKLVQLIGISASSGGLVFLLVNVLDQPLTLLPVIGGATTVAVLGGTGALVWLSRRIGKRGGYMLSAAVTGLTALSWTLAMPGESIWLLAARGFLLGIAFSGNVMFAMSMLTDAMEVDRLKTGLRREGMYSAFYSFVEKLASSVGPLIMGTALSLAGYKPDLTQQDPEAVRQAILVGIAYVPALMAVLACTILVFYKLDEEALRELREPSRP